MWILGKFQLRLRAPTGTRVERTEVIALKALDAIKAEAGGDNVAITLGFVGRTTDELSHQHDSPLDEWLAGGRPAGRVAKGFRDPAE